MLKKTMGMKLLVSLLIWEPKDLRDVENYQDRIYRNFNLFWVSQMQVHGTLGEKGIYTSLKAELPFDINLKLKKSHKKHRKQQKNENWRPQ